MHVQVHLRVSCSTPCLPSMARAPSRALRLLSCLGLALITTRCCTIPHLAGEGREGEENVRERKKEGVLEGE